MGQKVAKKKKKHISSGKQATPWPNLPYHLISLIERQPNLMQNITSFGCVTKSWRSPHKQCTTKSQNWPQLVEIHGKKRDRNQENARRHIIEISFHEEYPYPYYKRRSYKKWHPGIYFKGYSHGQLLVLGADMSECYLSQPPGYCTHYLPPWDRNLVFKIGMLTSSPEDPKCYNVMVVTGTSSPAFAFHRWGKSSDSAIWTVENCNIKEPYDPSQNMQFSNVIGFKGKFYALSLQGSVVVIEDVDSCFRITRIGADRGVPSKLSRQFREYLVESDGEILLVFLISRKSIDVVEDVEVFRLDIDKLLWVKVERIGDRALFVEDECCMWVKASKVGCKKNCIYFTHHRVDKWLIFDMESGHISPAFGNDTEIWGEGREME